MGLYTGGRLSLAYPEMMCRAYEPEIDHMMGKLEKFGSC